MKSNLIGPEHTSYNTWGESRVTAAWLWPGGARGASGTGSLCQMVAAICQPQALSLSQPTAALLS